MVGQALPILLGFLLTTVIGGLFASFLQQRSWRHQNESRLREQDIDRASGVCQSLSALVDKRLYRMRRLLWATVAHSKGQLARDVLDARLGDYDEVLLEWNDELNARLAIVGAYFGGDLRDFLDRLVYKAFTDAGQRLESLYRASVDQQSPELDPAGVDEAHARLNALNDLSYRLGFTMMVRIREGRVGRDASTILGETPLDGDR
jgi:hypothetical protein